MALVLDLLTSQQNALNRFGFSLINWRVVAYVDTFAVTGTNADGSYIYDVNTIESTTIDLTRFILNQDIILNASIPIFPTTDGKDTKSTNVDLQVANIYEVLGSVQNGAIIDIDNLYKSKVEIYLNFGPGVDELNYFTGQIFEIDESFGSTILRLRDSTFSIFQNANERDSRAYLFSPAKWAQYYVTVGGLVVNNPIVISPTLSYPDQNMKIYHGICIFDENGNIKTSVEGVDGAVYEIREINFYYPPTSTAAPLLGKYTVEFTSNTAFVLSTPNSQQFAGDISLTFTNGNVIIPSTAWTIIQPTEMTGQKFTFYNSYVVSGNPITLVKDLIGRAYTNDWVTYPINYSFGGVDWQGFDYYEMLFRNIKVYVTEFNADNSVFLPLSKNINDRLTCKQIIAKILSHVGCQLTFDNQGRVSMNTTWYSLGGKSIWQLGSVHCGEADTQAPNHSTNQVKPIKFFKVLYGFNKLRSGQNFSTQYAQGAVVTTDKDVQEIIQVGFEYYKTGLNKLLIESKIASLLWGVMSLQHIRMSAKVLPNFGVSLQVGDKFIADFTVQPILPNIQKGIGKYWQIYNISKGKLGTTIDAVCIPAPVRADLICQTLIICVSKIT